MFYSMAQVFSQQLVLMGSVDLRSALTFIHMVTKSGNSLQFDREIFMSRFYFIAKVYPWVCARPNFSSYHRYKYSIRP